MSLTFIGIGSGRCGTQSLARILGECGGAEVTHESTAYRSRVWGEISREAVERFAEDAENAGGLFGDVAFYHLPVIDQFISRVPDIKIVSMVRDRDSVARSFERKTKGAARLGSSFSGWDKFFPHIEAPTALDAWREYWERYYQKVRSLTPDVHWVRLDELNNDDSLNDLYDFLGVAPVDRAFPDQRRYNASRPRKQTRKRR